LSIPLDPKVSKLSQLPYTISYVIRKMQQIDNLNELPKEKRPPQDVIWDGTSDDMDEWLETVLSSGGKKNTTEVQFIVDDIES